MKLNFQILFVRQETTLDVVADTGGNLRKMFSNYIYGIYSMTFINKHLSSDLEFRLRYHDNLFSN
jgi:hypothetical protein